MNHQKFLNQPDQHPYPHMGALLQRQIRAHALTYAALALKLGIAPTGLARYAKQPSLQAAILWKAGLALKYNFFQELAKQFPYAEPDAAAEAQHAETESLLREKDRRIAEMEKELVIYKEIVLGRQG